MTGIDDLLRADAARWRAEPQSTPDLDMAVARAVRVRRRTIRLWAPIVAAAAIVALAVGLTLARSPSPRTVSGVTGSPGLFFGVVWQQRGGPLQLVFEPGELRTWDGCDGKVYRLTIDSDQLRRGAGTGPETFCAGPSANKVLARREQQADDLLAGTVRWTQSAGEGELTLRRGGAVERFLSLGPAPTLVGTTWKLVRQPDGGSAEGTDAVTFRARSKGVYDLTGAPLPNGSCGAHGTFRSHAEFITFTPYRGETMCPGTVPREVTRISALLTGTARFAIWGSSLHLDIAGDDIVFSS